MKTRLTLMIVAVFIALAAGPAHAQDVKVDARQAQLLLKGASREAGDAIDRMPFDERPVEAHPVIE